MIASSPSFIASRDNRIDADVVGGNRMRTTRDAAPASADKLSSDKAVVDGEETWEW
jgi:hypothetical protein